MKTMLNKICSAAALSQIVPVLGGLLALTTGASFWDTWLDVLKMQTVILVAGVCVIWFVLAWAE